MNLDTLIRVGSRPWQPNPRASALEVWHADDVPIVGTFKMDELRVLFMAVGGEIDGSLTVWAYLPVEEARYELLDSRDYDSLEELLDAVEAEFEDRCFVLATSDDFVLEHWTSLDRPAEDVYSAALDFLRQLTDHRRRSTRSARHRADVPPRASTAQHVEAFLDYREEAELVLC